MAEGEDRTQAPSERRLQRAREDGQAPMSREIVVAGGLAAAALVLSMGAPGLAAGMGRRLRDMMLDLGRSPGVALEQAGQAWMIGAVPMVLAILLAGAGAVLLQTGFLVHGGAMAPDFARLDPRRGLKRVFGLDNGIETVKALLKLGIFTWAIWHAMLDFWPQSQRALLWTPGFLLQTIGADLLHLVVVMLIAQAGIAILDVAWVRWRFSQRMRMSREDLRQETKEADGDPRIKARIKQIRQARARRRMIAAVSKATVVVTNPTHYAVALAYERGTQAAPRVVAKGVDEVAARIREAAERSGIPLVANPPLARALYAVAMDGEVPAEHFRAVAEIIAYVWRLKGLASSQ